jgi:hypothetical protein
MKLNLKGKVRLPKMPRVNRSSSSNGSDSFLSNLWSSVKNISRKIAAFFMRNRVKRVLGVFILSLAVIVFLFELVFAGLIYIGKMDNSYVRTVAKVIPFPMVVVNFNAVSVEDYNFEYNYIEHFYTQSQREIPENISSQILDQLIDTKILETKAPSYGVKISSKEIDDTINELVNQSGGEEEVEKVLSSYYGLSLKEFRRLVRDQLLRMKMKDTVPVPVSYTHLTLQTN